MVEQLILLGLGAHRLWFLYFASELFIPLREWLGRRKSGWVRYLSGCPVCMGVWISGATLALLTWAPAVVWVLAIAEGLSLVSNIHRRLER